MPNIRPISDLRNRFAEISKIVHEDREPVFLTKNGRGDMVVMSIEQYDRMRADAEIYVKLKEAEFEARASDARYGHAEVFDKLREQLTNEEV
ncbi:MAG: type II toxin-antitoxin system Phd/YefM family antitoxin [Firmicutes bacterium]|nr:type II toxin-antitoxin system Phd/YefM family antitoxin [Bacillota bacterium]